MAITKIGAPLAGIRGTIGGITYSANKSCTYAKAWAMTSNPQTNKQSTERSFLSQMSEFWRSLSDAQRADWATFAALPDQELFNSLGESYYASGWNWFVKCNVRLLRLDRAKIKPIPTQARPAAPTINFFRVCVAGVESDLCVGGVVSASSQSPTAPASNAFDNLLIDVSRWQTTEFSTTGWLRYDHTQARNIKRYRIYPYSADLTMAPKNWTFEVFSAGDWQVVHTVTNAVFSAGQWNEYYFENPYTEIYSLLRITANNGNAFYLCIVEVEMYAGDVGSSVICYPQGAFDNAPAYDLVLHVSLGQTIGKSVQYPGYYETLVSKSPGPSFELIQDNMEAIFGTIAMNKSWFCRLFRQTQEGIRSAAATSRTITIGG